MRASNLQADTGVQTGSIGIALRPIVNLNMVAAGQDKPNYLLDLVAGGDGYLYLSGQGGRIHAYRISDGNVSLYLDMGYNGSGQPLIPGLYVPTSGANGFFGFAFHPDFNDNTKPGYHKIYTWGDEKQYVTGSSGALTGLPDFWHTEQYIPGSPTPTVTNYVKAPNSVFNVLREWTVNTSVSPPVVLTNSSRVLMRFLHPGASGHGGSRPRFGPDGYLYFSDGDGGGNTGGSTSNSTTDGYTNQISNGQDRTSPFGKVYRIDPIPTNPGGTLSFNGQYRIPANNPFVDGPTSAGQITGPNGGGTVPASITTTTSANMNGPGAMIDEIYAFGLRNPWKLDFDDRPGGDGKLYLAHVGTSHREAIDVIVPGGNYGYPFFEGSVPLITQNNYSGEVPSPPAPPITPVRNYLPDFVTNTYPSSVTYANPGTFTYIAPFAEYKTRRQFAPDGAASIAANVTGEGTAVLGGFVYRGSAIPALAGKFVFGDYESNYLPGDHEPPAGVRPDTGRIFYVDASLGNPLIYAPQAPFSTLTGKIGGIGQDTNGELYTAGLDGQVYKIVPQATADNPAIANITTDTGSSATDHITNDATLVLSGTAAAGNQVRISLWELTGSVYQSDGVIGYATASGSGQWTFNYTGTPLSDNTYFFSASSFNATDGLSAAGDDFYVTVDTTAPSAPTISSTINGNAKPILSGNAEANGTVKVYYAVTTLLGTTIASGSGTWSYVHTGTALTSGTYSLTARTTDVAGNTGNASSSRTLTVSASPPASPVIVSFNTDTGVSASDRITSDNTLSFAGTATSGTTTLTRAGAGTFGTGVVSGGNWTISSATPVADGTYDFVATIPGSNPSAAFTVTVDTFGTPPVITGAIGNATPTISGTAEIGSTVTVKRDGSTTLGTAVTAGNGTWTYIYSGTALAPGTHPLTATIVDLAGNASAASAAFPLLVGPGALFADWAVINIADPTKRGPLDTPFNDGLANLLKFGLVLNPAGPTVSGVVATTAMDGGITYPAIRFTRRLAAQLGDVSVLVKASLSPGFTSLLGVTEVSATPVGDGITETVIVRSNVSLATGPQQYFRVSASLPGS